MATGTSTPPSNLLLRVITGVVGIAVLVTALGWGGPTGFFLVFLALGCLCQAEFYTLLKQNGEHPDQTTGIALGVTLYIAAFFICAHPGHNWVLSLAALPFTAVFVRQLYKQDAKPMHSIAFTLLGVLYCQLPFAMFCFAALSAGGVAVGDLATYEPAIVLGILSLLWASDSGAYFAGRALGRTALFARHSPKKTWEGLAGGAVAAGLVVWGLSVWAPALAGWQWAIVAGTVVGIGTWGDLVESMFKRSLSIKDSGTVLPGHGGFLDRFDGLLVCLPLVVAEVLAFRALA